MLWVLILGLLLNIIVLPLAARRVLFLYRAITMGQPAPDRIAGVTGRIGAALKRQVVEVFGQKKLLKWSLPGAAHFFVFWAFVILGSVYVEAYGSLLKLLFTGGDGHLDWAIPIIGHWALLGFAQDFIAVMALFGLAAFVYIRVKNAPKDLGRGSRFFGSHLSGAWITLGMIFNVIWTMFLFRGASSALGNLPYDNGAFASIGVGKLMDGLSEAALEVLEGIGLLLHIGVMLAFLLFVLNSKHLHIFLAPLNVLFGRAPVALGAAKPMTSNGKALTLDDLEDLDEDAKLGVGAAEDFSWKGILDFATCTECGRCQSQCPAWNTEKPLSPKLLIMALRDHTLGKAPYLLADEDKREALLEGDEKLAREVERPLVGDTGDDWFYMPDSGAGAIDPDVLWSCVTCGACVEQCPVDIEHVDHIVDMRRYQVLVESNFPSELNGLFKGMESKGNPWNMSPTARMDWAKDLPFEVKVVGEDIESLDEVEWLFWVGCAGAYEDRAKKTTRAVAELLDMAGVSFGVLGNGETCTGDSARRAGNEFVFQGLAQQNVETFKEYKVKKVVSTCAHCFNTLRNEYRELGIELDVVHHTQLLNRLVREKKLTPIRTPERSFAGPHQKPITYHDPCYLGRHNQVYEAPRELLNVLPDTKFVEMPRNSERSFCCGAGGARMWMEETIGSRINETRTAEAVATGAEQIAVGCPFCRVMLSDGLTSQQSKGEAREEVEVLDVAQMLLAAVKGEQRPAAKATAGAASAKAGAAGGATATATIEREETDEATKAEPDASDVTQTEDTVTDTEDVGPAAKASGGSSLFDVGDDADDADQPAAKASGGGSLFDLGDDSGDNSGDSAAAQDEPAAKASGGGSLFDLGDDSGDDSGDSAPSTDESAAAPAAKAGSSTESDSDSDSGDEGFGGSLFDVGGESDEADTPSAPASENTSAPEPAGAEPASGTETDTGTEQPAGVAEESSDEGFAGGSLFDLGDDSSTDTASDTATDTGGAASAEPQVEDTGDDVDRSQDAADTDVAPDQEQDQPEVEPESKAETETGTETGTEPGSPDASQVGEADGSPSAPTTSRSSGGITPATEIPEGGSLFDIEAPAEEPAAASGTSDQTESGQDETGEDAAADSTTDGEVDRSEDAADTDVAPDEESQPSEPEPSEPEPSQPSNEDAPLTSLKDIKAKYADSQGGDSAPDAAADGEAQSDDAATAEESESGPVEESEGDEPSDVDQASGEGEQDEREDQPSTSSGPAHQPRTDAEIGEGGSLFDL